jgi:hypothetical protein
MHLDHSVPTFGVSFVDSVMLTLASITEPSIDSSSPGSIVHFVRVERYGIRTIFTYPMPAWNCRSALEALPGI